MSSAKLGTELVVRAGKTAISPVNINWQIGKFKNQLPCLQADAGLFERHLRRVDYIYSHYPRMGLLHDDILYEKKKNIQEARLRMSEEQTQARTFRCIRACVLQAKKDLLPEEEWTPMDAEHCYLRDILHQVNCEIFEKNLIKCATGDYDGLIDKVSLSIFRIRHFPAIQAMKAKLSNNLLSHNLV